jgi:hypothetical protein
MRNPDFFLSSTMTLSGSSAKSFGLLVSIAFALAAVCPGFSQVKEKPDDVGVAVTASRDTLAPGAASEILFTLTPKKGLHVNGVPPMVVKFDSGSPAVAGDTIIIPADTATGYLKSSLPVRLPFTVAKAGARGRVEVKGVLTYYYCSDAEGWCRKENLRFALPLTVK